MYTCTISYIKSPWKKLLCNSYILLIIIIFYSNALKTKKNRIIKATRTFFLMHNLCTSYKCIFKYLYLLKKFVMKKKPVIAFCKFFLILGQCICLRVGYYSISFVNFPLILKMEVHYIALY